MSSSGIRFAHLGSLAPAVDQALTDLSGTEAVDPAHARADPGPAAHSLGSARTADGGTATSAPTTTRMEAHENLRLFD